MDLMRKRLKKAKLEIESLFIVFDEVHFTVDGQTR